jgi:surfactin synthase thioesterase subunit
VLETVEQLVEQLTPHLLPFLDRPVVIWGHSFGGIVAWDVVRRIRECHHREPAHYVVSGTLPPHLLHLLQKRDTLLKAMVLDNSPEYLISLSRYVDDPEFLKSILPLMRQDYPLLKSYRYQPSPRLRCPITAFAARRDDMVYIDEIQEWDQHTHSGFELIEVDGDHWFLNRNRERIAAALEGIAERLRGDASNRVVAYRLTPSEEQAIG